MMTITLTPIAHGNLCHGSRWIVEDVDLLAERVGRVALGQYRHVARILEGLEGTPPATSKEFARDAKSKLKVAKNHDPWQRDGWLFQVISWITANQVKTPGTVIEPPHIFHAHKGFDGMQLDIAGNGTSIEAIVIFEDKATIDPRSTIRRDVWKAISDFEAGERITELAHEATGLLEAHQHAFPNLNVDEAIDRIIWKEARRYRVSITTGKAHQADADRERLFGGYDDQAGGAIIRRRAETMHFDDLRVWMNDFAALVEKKIDEIVGV
jgi:hypothetical protein